MQVMKISFNENKDETKVIFTQSYQEAHRVTKLDVLQDAIATLQQQYNSLMKEGN